jgi:hypothetical protein
VKACPLHFNLQVRKPFCHHSLDVTANLIIDATGSNCYRSDDASDRNWDSPADE